MKEFFDVLFDPEEGICTGSAFATNVFPYVKEGEFFCVNPLDTLRDHGAFKKDEYSEYVPRRADINVSKFRNFIFEMDSIPLDDQLKIFRNSEIPFTSIIFSGGKSYHAILGVEPSACGEEHTRGGIDEYKKIWRRLSAKIDKEAIKLGYSYPKGQNTFIDHSCQNPSRLTRYPEVLRDNGCIQELMQLTERMEVSEFLALLSECPMIRSIVREENQAPEDPIENVQDFEAACPPGLLRDLKYVPWAAPENCYHDLFRVTKWAIDTTNVTRETFIEFLDKYTFKTLLGVGYPEHKLTIGVDHAYRDKGQL